MSTIPAHMYISPAHKTAKYCRMHEVVEKNHECADPCARVAHVPISLNELSFISLHVLSVAALLAQTHHAHGSWSVSGVLNSMYGDQCVTSRKSAKPAEQLIRLPSSITKSTLETRVVARCCVNTRISCPRTSICCYQCDDNQLMWNGYLWIVDCISLLLMVIIRTIEGSVQYSYIIVNAL